MSLLAFGYVIRIDAGSKVIELESSNIMLLSTFFLAFFFISLKRLGELNVLSSYKKNINIRPVLNFYSSKILKCIAIVSFLILDLLILLYIYYNDIYLLIVFILGLIFLSKYYFITRNSVLGESPINLILKDKTLLFIAITSLFIILFVYL